MKQTAVTAALAISLGLADVTVRSQSVPIDIGDRLELFVDRHLIESLDSATLRLHPPIRAGIALRFDRPWEGAFSGYVTVLEDAGRFKMYYRGLPKAGADGSTSESTCYAESRDGIRWEKPNLGLFEFAGSRDNNIILRGFEPASHNFSPFLDANPQAPAAERFKALGGSSKGLLPFVSADGIRWRQRHDKPVITKGAFDSQNVSFWSAAERCYVCYFRTWDGYRSVSRARSKDFIRWTEPVAMSYGNTQREHLYTNQTHPYFRAPHIYVGVAARFMPGRRVLTPERAKAIDVHPRYANDCSDAVLLISRGGATYDRTFMEAFIRPGRGDENWVSRTNYPALGVVPTGAGELSLYVQKNYGQPTARLDRYTIRQDGFASIHGPYSGGEVITKPLRFTKLGKTEIAQRRTPTTEGAITIERVNPIQGKASFAFHRADSLTLPNTRKLGSKVTLAVTVRDVPRGHRRLFSSYDGGSTKPGELILDINSGGPIDRGDSIRFLYNGLRVGARFDKVGDFSKESGDGRPHRIAATWNDGEVTISIDDKVVGRGGKRGLGTIQLRRNLRFGEDYAPTRRDNEPFLGLADEITISSQTEHVFHCEGPDWGQLVPDSTDQSAQRLILNFATSAAGRVRVEIQDQRGRPIEGYTLADATDLIGDELERAVRWRHGSDVSQIGGRTVRLRFVLEDADVFSMRFR